MKYFFYTCLALVLVVAGLMLLYRLRASNSIDTDLSQAIAESAAAADREWTTDEFDADVYPSERAVGRHLGETWATKLEDANEPVTRIRIAAGPTISAAARREIEAAFQRRLHRVECQFLTIDRNNPDDAAKEAALRAEPLEKGEARLMLDESVVVIDPGQAGTSRSPGKPRIRQCFFALSPLGPDARGEPVSVQLADKLWADDLGAYAEKRPESSFFVARCARPCASEHEAREQAQSAAVARLLPMVRYRIRSRSILWMSVDDRLLTDLIKADLHQVRPLIEDSFVQRFNRSYGPVWRQALLIDASPHILNRIADRYVSRQAQGRESWAKTIVSTAALFAVIYVLYLLVNAVTKGYFRGGLRTAAVVIGILGAVVVVLTMFMTVRTVEQPRAEPEMRTQEEHWAR